MVNEKGFWGARNRSEDIADIVKGNTKIGAGWAGDCDIGNSYIWVIGRYSGEDLVRLVEASTQ